MSDAVINTYIAVSRIIAKSISDLLETKHLYQNITINEEELKPLYSKFHDELDAVWKSIYSSPMSLLQGQWYFASGEENYIPEKISSLEMITIYLTKIQAFCANCEQIEPMNLNNSTDSLIGMTKNNIPLYKMGIQLFCMNFLCQSCRIPSESFLIFRNHEKLVLCGRNPMELVIAPKDIPKNVKKYYSDAVIANNSGKNLAGLFYLRTLIEQYIRDKYKLDEPIDKLIDKYMEELPEDYKQRNPSIKELYSNLSAAIHKAEESEGLFKGTIEKISLHFEAKRIYKIEN